MHKLWVKREFYMIVKLHNAGANIPKPVAMTKNAILMEYIGDESYAAPLLKDVNLAKEEIKNVYQLILNNISIFYDIGIVHGDLSPYNILYWNEEPYIIDFPQSADIRNNPNTDELLKRDKENIEKWYKEQMK